MFALGELLVEPPEHLHNVQRGCSHRIREVSAWRGHGSDDGDTALALGVAQGWTPYLGIPVWRYLGETFTNYTLWRRRPGDELIVVIAENATSAPTKLQLESSQSGSSSLYERVMEILDPQSVTNPTAVSQPLGSQEHF